MTELLFQKDSYLKEFKCKVVNVDEEQNAVVLSKTAFYIGGGGQPCDIGILETYQNSYTVKKVKKIGNNVYHYIEGKLPKVNESCTGKIDWEHRYKLMRTHTAMHILCGVVWRDYKAQVTGGDMDCLKARMDFEFENFDKELIDEIEALDLQADGGTHVKNTAEVGKIKIVKYKSKGKINKRIYVELEE